MVRIALGKTPQKVLSTLNHVAFKDDRIILQRNGKDVAAIIPIADLKHYEALEDAYDIAASDLALADAIAKGEKTIPWEVVKAKLDLLEFAPAKKAKRKSK